MNISLASTPWCAQAPKGTGYLGYSCFMPRRVRQSVYVVCRTFTGSFSHQTLGRGAKTSLNYLPEMLRATVCGMKRPQLEQKPRRYLHVSFLISEGIAGRDRSAPNGGAPGCSRPSVETNVRPRRPLVGSMHPRSCHAQRVGFVKSSAKAGPKGLFGPAPLSDSVWLGISPSWHET